MKNTFIKSAMLVITLTVTSCGPTGEDLEAPIDGKCPAPYWENYNEAEFLSFFNDSLALYKTSKAQYEYEKEYYFLEGDKCEPHRTGSIIKLWLANYRVKQKPLLIDTLNLLNNYYYKIVPDYFKDSSLLVSGNDEFGLWKIGTDSVDLKKMSNSISIEEAILWKDDNILLKYYYSKLGVLDTKTGNIEPFDNQEQERLSTCKDISYVNDNIICLRPNLKEGFYELVVDNITTDVNVIDSSVKASEIYFYGNYLLENNIKVFKINSEGLMFDKTFTPNEYVDYTGETFE